MPKDQSSGKKLADMLYGGPAETPSGAAFGVFPQMKPRRAAQSESNISVPLMRGLARGFVSGAGGVFGDAEELVRMLANTPGAKIYGESTASMMPGQYKTGEVEVGTKARLPTSEDIEKLLPFRQANPSELEQLATGAGQLAGGFYTGPGAPVRLVTGIPKAVVKAGRDFALAAGQPAVNVIKSNKGGNWLDDRLGRELQYLKSPPVAGETPAQRIPRHQALLKDPSVSPESRATVERHLNEEVQRDAVDQWIGRNLTNYIKNQMATPEDPVRLMLDRRTAEIEGKFLKDAQRADKLAARAAAEVDPRRKANLTREAEQAKAAAQEERDLSLQHLLPSQASVVRNSQIAEEEARQARVAAGFPEEGMGQSPAAKAWENVTEGGMGISSSLAQNVQEAVGKARTTEELIEASRAKGREIEAAFVEKLKATGQFNEKQIDALSRSSPVSLKLNHVDPTLAQEYTSLSNAAEEARRQYKHADLEIAKQYPWAEKLDPQTKLYEFYGSHEIGFDHIIDVLKQDLAAGRITVDQLNRMSVDQVIQRAADYDKELAAAMNASRAAAREGLPVYKEYPQGYRWVELNKPGAFSAESEAMGHSVRGYEPPKGHPDWTESSGDSGSGSYGQGGWEAIKSGRAKVYSLVDPKGNPHVTVEVGRPQPRSEPEEMRAIYDQASAEANAKNLQTRDEWNQFYFPRVTELQDALLSEKSKTLPPRITQIKGKQNQAPNEEYLPFVQDFVRSGQWSDVGDLSNTGLFKVTPGQKLPGFSQEISPGYYSLDDFRKMAAENEMPQDILDSWMGKLQNQSRYGYKSGGTVHFSDNPDTMRLELAGGGLVKGLKAAAKAAQKTAPVAQEVASVQAPVRAPLDLAKLKSGGIEVPQAGFSKEDKAALRPLYNQGLIRVEEREGKKILVPGQGAWYEFATPQQQSVLNTLQKSQGVKDLSLMDPTESLLNSAQASFFDFEIVPGVRNVPIKNLEPFLPGYDSPNEMRRIESLANQIKESKQIEPLFVGVDPTGAPYIMEGQHRIRALKSLGYDEVPARVVIDMDDLSKAEGGAVSFTDNPETMKLELAGGGAVRMQAGGLSRLFGAGTKAAKAAKDEVQPNLVIKSKPGIIVSDLIDEDPEIAKRMGALARAKRQADIAAEGKRQEAAKKVEPSVGYRPSTPLNPDPLVGTRFVNEAPFGLNPNEPFDISKFKGGSGLVLPWDSQSRNVRTTQVSGMDLPNQIFRETHGGVPYSFDTQHAAKGVVGASGEDIAKRVKTRADTAVRENIARGGTGELLHFPITMGARAEDYALPYSEFSFDIINHKLMTGELTKADADKLSDMVRNFEPPKYKGKKPFADFAGFTSPEGLNQIYTGQGLKAPSGELRKAIADRIIWQKGSQEKLGFNAEDLMNATTYEPLRGVDKGFIGSSVMRNSPTGMRLSPSAGKYPYDTDFSGAHLGRLADNVDVEAVFYRTLNPIKRELMQRETKKPYTRESLRNAAIGAIEKRNENVSQILDQQFLDDLDTYFTELKKPTEYQQGGAVRKAAGGDVHGLSASDMLYLQSQEDISKLPPQAQREAIVNMGGRELRERMAGKYAAGGDITAEDLTIEERPL